MVGGELGRSTGEVLSAYAAGFEAMGALARASHPALYDAGWHPTAVCGGVGAAVAAAELLGAPREPAVALALLRASGLRAAFGSQGKSLQVGLAAASGVQAARLAHAGARVPLEDAARGFEEATGGTYAEPEAGDPPAVEQNWIKAWPCCLQTHGAIEAAAEVRDDAPEELSVTVHPVSLQAASVGPDPSDGLQAKFSIPYLTAYTLMHGPPTVESFESVDAEVVERARRDRDPHRSRSARVRVRAPRRRERDRPGEGGAGLAAEADGPRRPWPRRSAASPGEPPQRLDLGAPALNLWA